jgi:hypothetical protein
MKLNGRGQTKTGAPIHPSQRGAGSRRSERSMHSVRSRGRRHRKRRLVRELGGSRQGNRHPWGFSPDDRDWLCSPDRSRRCVSLHMLVTAAEFLLGPSWGRFPVFATCPVVILAHSQTIADQGEKKGGHREFHSSRRTSSTASSPWPFEDSLRGLATKTRMGRHVGAWWRRPQARKERSSPTLPSPGGLTPNLWRLALHRTCGIRGRGSDCPIAVTWGGRLQAAVCRRCAA